MVSIPLALSAAGTVPSASRPLGASAGSAVGVDSLKFVATDDANDAAQWPAQLAGYASACILKVRFYADTAVSGDVLLGASISSVTPGAATDMETLAWGAESTATISHPGSEGQRLQEASITIADEDGAADGALVQVRLRRVTTTGNADTLAGDVQVTGAWLEYTAGEAAEPPVESGLWSEAGTWGGAGVPGIGDDITIGVGETVTLDTATASIGALTVNGLLVAEQGTDVAITAASITIGSSGELRIGTSVAPYTNAATITLTGARSTHTERDDDTGLDNDGISRGLRVMSGGGKLVLHGDVPTYTTTKLNAHAAATATTLTTADSSGWQSGDVIAISKTDFYDVGDTESYVLGTNASGTTVTLPSGLVTPRWGVLQYPVDAAVDASGLSLTPGTFTPPDPLTPTVLDERATLINLSRNIVIQGADDTDWSTNGFGAHVMVMGQTSTAQVQGVEFRRVGQRRAIGRYPFHWHMCSYDVGTGALLGDLGTGLGYIRDCAVWDSENRAITIHGTNGATVQRNNCFDIKGHAIFFEDGSERRNICDANVCMKIRDPGTDGRIKIHDTKNDFDTGASGIWMTNPDNEVTNNSCSDCDARGIWNAFSATPFGLSALVSVVPNTINILLNENNNCHSNRLEGMATDMVVTNEAGNVGSIKYESTNSTFTGNTLWKHSRHGYRNRVKTVHYKHWVQADNDGKDWSGVTARPSTLVGPLCFAQSLNNATAFSTFQSRNAFASYHWELNIIDATLIGYTASAAWINGNGQFVRGGGCFSMEDLYIHPIGTKQLTTNTGWYMINSYPGYVTPPPYFDDFAIEYPSGSFRYWGLSVTIDGHGYWGNAGDYMVWDDPFWTTGLSSSSTHADQANLILTPDRFFGLAWFQLDDLTPPYYEYSSPEFRVRLAHLDTSYVEQGVWDKGDTDNSSFFNDLSGQAVHNGSIYLVTFPDSALPVSSLLVYVMNAWRDTDSFLIGIPWPNGTTAKGRLDAGRDTNITEAERITEGWTRLWDFSTATSAADVLADDAGVLAWQDTTNNTVWVHIVGGLNYPSRYYSLVDPLDDDVQNLPMTIHLEEDV